MPPRQREMCEIRPAAPDDSVRGLLVLSLARHISLEAGDRAEGYGKTGEYVLVSAVGGQLTVTSHAQYSLLSPGQVLLLHEPGAYTVQAVSQCVYMGAVLEGEIAQRLLPERLEEGAALFSQGAAAVRETVLALEVLDRESPPVGGALASSYAYSLLMKLRDMPAAGEGEDAGISPLVESAIAVIQEEFPFLEGVDELAQRLEVSKSHLIRTFTRQTGTPPGKYITRVRLEYAKLLLQERENSVTYVAEACGFANANYFAKVFRRETGMSPSEYLESAPKRKGPVYRGPGLNALW